MAELMRPEDLKKIATDIEMAKVKEYLEKKKKHDDAERGLREVFLERDIHPQAKDRINAAVSRAAEQGLNEIAVFTFPAKFCTDGGRRINNNLPDWPVSLDGFAKRAYEYFEKELKPLGYKIRVQIMDYPDGVPGNVSMFLKW